MSKKILVNATLQEENRVAIVEDGILTGLDIEVAGREPSKGNIYKAVVVRVEAGLQAAFVDYGAERLGFLQIDEVNFATVRPELQDKEEGRRPRINDLLHRGQEILVQIVKEERGTKGAALTTYLSLAGRYMVLMPGSDTRGVSRRAESDAQRKQLKKAMSSLEMADGVGYIVRTAALDQTREELERDYLYLIRLYESICELEKKVKAPTLIYRESNLIIRSIRDYFTTDMDEVLIDDPQVFQEAKDFFQLVMPDQVHLVKLHQERRPIFSRYQIEDQIDTLSRNKVTLPSGGSIVIDQTEALVAIDVNSGKMSSEQGVEATATKTNLEAATEVGRQLRLRDLGGLIVIDFIDMRESKHMRQVEAQLKKSLENDKARVSVGRISQFGLLEMSRQRIKASLTAGSHLTCPHCHGAGHVKSPESSAAALLRRIHAAAAKGQVARVEVRMHLDVASFLLNNKREDLLEIERRYQLQIHILGAPNFLSDQVEIEILKKEKEKSSSPEPVEARTQQPVVSEERKPAEKPVSEALPVATPESQEPAAAESSEAPQSEPAKKKRRRKRRKPSGEATAAVAGESSEAQDQGEEASADEGEETTAGSSASEQSVPAKKPRRRRSRGRGRSKHTATEGATASDTAAEPVVAEAATVPAAAPAVPTTAPDVPKTEPAAKPRPARGRGAKKPLDNQPPSATPAEPAIAPVSDSAPPQAQQEPETAATPTPGEVQAKPKRPRRPAKKKPVEGSSEAPQAAAQEAPQAEAPAKPARKVPAKRAASKAPAKPVEAKTEVPVQAPAAEGEKPKTKPRRPAKRKPAEKPPIVEPTTE